jgi:transcriptional regulator with PAS, ATPase and Fis domain
MLATAQTSLQRWGIIGDSTTIKALACQLETAARSDLTVLISGESGTGKELVARAIHQLSPRRAMPFVSLNCGALTETLLESELFGYERGAFTGASQSRRGLFATADNGTIFLDEIGEMSIACQVKLLRVLQENTIRPVGSNTEISLDVRVIAATNRDLLAETIAKRFREDLFYRLAVLTIKTPALREHPTDIPALLEHFLRAAEQKMKCSTPRELEPDALEALTNFAWPGNVRQLRHAAERVAATTADGELITLEILQRALPHTALSVNYLCHSAAQIPVVFREEDSLDDFLDRTMLGLYEYLRSQTGSHSKTARMLRTDRTSLYQRLERARRRMQLNAANLR